MNAESYAQMLRRLLVAAHRHAEFLEVRARGKTAALGYHDDGEWVPLLRVANGSAAYNVADLQVRRGRRWEPAFVRGVPDALAEALAGPLRFLWELHSPT